MYNSSAEVKTLEKQNLWVWDDDEQDDTFWEKAAESQ